MLELILIFIATLIFYNWITMKPKNYPPGPPCVPFLGSIPFLKSENFQFQMEEFREKYGPVVGLKLGPGNAIAICGPKEVEEVLKREEFQGRPAFPDATKGVMFAEGTQWVEQRRFSLRHLRDFGFGKKSTENVIWEEAEDLSEKVLKKNEIVQASGLFNISVINVLWAMIAGTRFDVEDEKFKHLLLLLQRRFRAGNVVGGVSAVFPRLAKLFPEWSGKKEIDETNEALNNFLLNTFKEHKQNKGEEPRDFIDVYLAEVEKREGSTSSFNENILLNVCTDLFSAGAESVGNTLGFCLLYMVLYPEWQEKMYEEIESVVGKEYPPSLDDKPRLPLVEAFMTEVTRCNTIASLAVPHKSTKDTTLNGYFIPKNAFLLISIWSILQDKKTWGDPENFRPDRFLDSEGNFKKESASKVPIFGIGKRICLGESLARSSMFLFLTYFVQKFQFSIPKGQPKPSTICLPGFTNAPRPFEVSVKSRK